jgi:predicted nucleic acid-binding protein
VTAHATLVVDASVAVKWYVPENGSAEAIALLSSGSRLIAPDLLITEIGNILWKKVGRGALSPVDAEGQLQAFLDGAPVVLYSSSTLVQQALRTAMAFGRTVYDSLYIALALAEGCRLVTADERLVNSLQGTPLAGSIVALASI